jgi:hypothetical protein
VSGATVAGVDKNLGLWGILMNATIACCRRVAVRVRVHWQHPVLSLITRYTQLLAQQHPVHPTVLAHLPALLCRCFHHTCSCRARGALAHG